MKAASLIVSSCAIALLCACSTVDRAPGSREAFDVSVPYRSGGAGFGGSAHSDMAIVPPGKHATFVAAQCLQGAMQVFNAQMLQPDVLALTERDTDVKWQSDVGLLSVDQMRRYNAQATHPPLRDRLFGVRFSGRLKIIDNELRFSIQARMSGRGAGEGWQELDEKDYDGAFFTLALAERLKERLRATQEPK